MPHLIQLYGHNDEAVFHDDSDYEKFYQYVNLALGLYSIQLHAYSLTPQRILLFLSAPDKKTLGGFMQYLGRRYVPYYNHRYHRHGALWESRYGSCPVEPYTYSLLVKKYVECASVNNTQHRSFADSPFLHITPHDEYLRLGENAIQRLNAYRHFCLGVISPAVVARIESALAQNCLLATTPYSRVLESKLQRNLRPRRSGRPRKHLHNPVARWEWLEKKAEYLLQQYCYREIRMPLLERLEQNLIPPFSNEINEFPLSHQVLLRGDGTQGCLRVLLQYQNLQTATRLWYRGTLFRRQHQHSIGQFHQLGVEAFGYPDIGIEIELLLLQFDFFNSLQLLPYIELKLNTLGTTDNFVCFRQALQQYYRPVLTLLNARQAMCFNDNPEQLLIDDDPLLRRMSGQAPRLEYFISEPARDHFNKLCRGLTELSIPFTYDATLFPTNDYNGVLFEWHAESLHNNSLLCRGGRYDNSASRLIGKPVSACGFAFMLEPIMQLLACKKMATEYSKSIDVVIIPGQSRACDAALLLGRKLRSHFPQLSILNDCSTLRLPTRQKNAQRLGARFILIMENSESDITFCDEESHSLIQIPVEQILAHLSRALVM